MDSRGQPVQVGVIILFGFLVVAFALFQAVVVPQQNAEVEFQHNQDVQRDVVELRGSLLRTASTGDGHPVSIRLGTTYPSRLIAVNPGPSSGSLRTVSPGGGDSLGVTNAEALDEETADFWDGDTVTYPTRGISYEPNYNVYQQAPATVYENSVVYNRGTDGANVTRTDQRLIDSRRLDLTVLQGEYQRSGSDAVSVGVSSPTAAPRTIVVHNSADPINVSVPTGLSNATWAQLLDDQFASNGGYVTSLKKTDGVLYVELDETRDGQTVTYELRVPAASVGTDVPQVGTAYLTDDSGDGATIPDTGSQQVVAEVRNEFNAPESGVETCAAVTRGPGSLDEVPTTVTSDADGQVSYTYVAEDVPTTQTAVVTVGYECDGGNDPEPSSPPKIQATFEIEVYDTGSGSSGGSSLRSANVTNLDNNSSSQTQDLTFTVDRDYSNGEQVVIDLSEAQRNNQVDYAGAGIRRVDGSSGSAEFTTQSGGGAEVTFTAAGSEQAGDTITAVVENVDATGGNADTNSPYDVIFEGPDADTITESFTVS